MIARFFIVVPWIVLSSACTSDGGIGGSSLPDAEVADAAGEVADSGGAAETSEDTNAEEEVDAQPGEDAEDTGGAEIEVSEDTTGEDTIGEDTIGEDTIDVGGPEVAEDTSAPEVGEDTSAPEVGEDTSAHDVGGDDAGDGGGPEVVEPACQIDQDCGALGIIVAPDQCVVPRCIEGLCTTAPRDCDDGDPCTLDGCDRFSGCVNTAPHLDLGARRFTFCGGPLAQGDAAAACLARDEALAVVGDERVAAELELLLVEGGGDEAWVASASALTCPVPRRIAPPQCVSLADVSPATACTAIEDCASALSFICERVCDDGDPCTEDIMGEDGQCSAVPICP